MQISNKEAIFSRIQIETQIKLTTDKINSEKTNKNSIVLTDLTSLLDGLKGIRDNLQKIK